MMWLSRPTSSGSGGHLSGGQLTGSSAREADTDRCAGSDVDLGVGDGGGERAGRAVGRYRPVGRGDRTDQAAPPWPYRRAAVGRDGGGAAGRGGLSGRAGPAAGPPGPANGGGRGLAGG